MASAAAGRLRGPAAALALALTVVCAAGGARAAPDFYTDPVAFSAVAINGLVEHFEGAAMPNTTLSSYNRFNGILYRPVSSSGNVFIAQPPGFTNFGLNGDIPSAVLTASGNEAFRIEFDTPPKAVAFDTYVNGLGPVEVRVVGRDDNGFYARTFEIDHDPTTIGFLGIVDPDSNGFIHTVRWTATGGETINTGIDNVRTGRVIFNPFEGYNTDFENGNVGTPHMVHTTASNLSFAGVTNGFDPIEGEYHFALRTAAGNTGPASSEFQIIVNTANFVNRRLRFDHRLLQNEAEVMPASFSGYSPGDGVAISDDGWNWHKVQGLTLAEGGSFTNKTITIDLDAVGAPAGIDFSKPLRVKFQQTRPRIHALDGYVVDNVLIFYDQDADGVILSDNCFLVANPDQHDGDGDGQGDLCDEDIDGDGVNNFLDQDDDGDGMPDDYETAHGLDPTNNDDGPADNDGDRRSNLAEYQDGTDPNLNEPATLINLFSTILGAN